MLFLSFLKVFVDSLTKPLSMIITNVCMKCFVKFCFHLKIIKLFLTKHVSSLKYFFNAFHTEFLFSEEKTIFSTDSDNIFF